MTEKKRFAVHAFRVGVGKSMVEGPATGSVLLAVDRDGYPDPLEVDVAIRRDKWMPPSVPISIRFFPSKGGGYPLRHVELYTPVARGDFEQYLRLKPA